MEEPRIEVRQSARRHKTASVRREGDRFVVIVPARLSRDQRTAVTASLVERLKAKERRTGTPAGDAALRERAVDLAGRFVPDHPEIVERLRTVSWSGARSRWGSCTAVSGTIRISDQLRSVPVWVLDHVLLHELVHLVHHGHGPEFRQLADRHPDRVRAEGFLAGYAHGLGRAGTDAGPDQVD